MNIKKVIGVCGLTLLPFGFVYGTDSSVNHIRYVFPVDYLTVEVVMEKPLTDDETNPLKINRSDFVPDFTFSDGLSLTFMPIEQTYDGMHDNTYRIAVDGMKEGTIYTISYKGQKGKTFKAYPLPEMQEKYKNRYGSWF